MVVLLGLGLHHTSVIAVTYVDYRGDVLCEVLGVSPAVATVQRDDIGIINLRNGDADQSVLLETADVDLLEHERRRSLFRQVHESQCVQLASVLRCIQGGPKIASHVRIMRESY